MTRRLLALFTAIALTLLLIAPASPSAAERSSKPAAPQAGKYRGTTFNDDGQPNKTEFVTFRVTKNGKKVKGLRARIGMYCYVGPPVYNQIIPTVVEAPPLKIRKGKVSRGWTEIYEVDGIPHTLTGRVTIKFKKGRAATGKIAVDFASCGTTTGAPADYIPFKVRRK